MIHVLASIQIKTGKKADFIRVFKNNIPNVLTEQGCIEYTPVVDVETGLSPQVLDSNIVTIIEKWESLEALKSHLKAPHMLTYREQVKDIVETASIKVLMEA